MDLLKKMKLTVPKRILFFAAALVWGFAGQRILAIGFTEILKNTKSYWLNILIGLVGFYFFFKYVFYKMFLKHTKRIINSKHERLFILAFFDIKGFCIMAFMITFGITLRKLNIVPTLYLGTFYISLGLSLFTAALSFLYSGIRYKDTKVKYKIDEDKVEEGYSIQWVGNFC